jgi:glycerol kinase
MPQYVLALDQGTSSSRAILFNHSGTAVAASQQPFEQIYPQPGWVEHDPEEIWRTQMETARHVMRQAGADAGAVAAIGITNQRETTVIWDHDGKPVHNAIVWQDRRTAPICEELRSRGLEQTFRQRTGLLLDPYFSGTKVKWLLDNVSGLRRRAEAGELMFGTVDSWLLYRLTGVHATDYTNAGRSSIAAAGRAGVFRRLRRDRAAGWAYPRGGRRRRPAGGTLRTSRVQAGHGEEHVRNGLLRADERGR